MSDRRKTKGKAIYNNAPAQQSPQSQQPPQQTGQTHQVTIQQPQTVTIQQPQTVTIHQPRVVYGKQMPVSVQTQPIPDQNVRIIYAQQPPMQVQMQVSGDPNVRTAYVLSNQHIPINTLQVQDGSMIGRSEQVVCEVDLRQYQQMQVATVSQQSQQQQQQQQQPPPPQQQQQQQQQQQSQQTAEEHLRTTVMTTQFQQTTDMQGQQITESQQIQTFTLITPRKKEKVLLPCSHCKDSFRTECQLQAHIRNKHIKPFKCDNCWKAFSFESQLKLHVTTHTGEKPYKCDVCPKAYARKTALFNHVRVHARKKFFKCCKYCGKGFKNEMKLEKHERMHSMGDERKYVSLEMFVENK